MKWSEIIQDTAWVVEDLLTAAECQQFLERAANMEQMTTDTRHRDCMTMAVDDAEMAQRVWDRIKDHIPQEVTVTEDCTNPGLKDSKADILGTWRPYGLNYRWRIVCYPGRGHFAPHRDGCHQIDEHHRSLLTLNGYLTDRPVGFGGATRFLKDDVGITLQDDKFVTAADSVLHRVEADKAGKAVVFFHDLMHDGEPLLDGSPPKWLFRTEIMFERDVETAPSLSDDQHQARELLRQAEQAEKAGEITEAMKLYSRAYRLDPELEVPNSKE